MIKASTANRIVLTVADILGLTGDENRAAAVVQPYLDHIDEQGRRIAELEAEVERLRARIAEERIARGG